jgi:hypothetical protein
MESRISPTTLVFSGGGTRCLVLAEMLFLVEKHSFLRSVRDVWGTSAGALIAGLYAITHSAERVKTLLWELDFTQFRNVDVNLLLNINNSWSIDDGSHLLRKIEELFELCVPHGSSFRLRDFPGLHIVVADLSVRETIVLDSKTFPDLKITEAVRASMTLPIFLKPFVGPNGHIWVDGGVRANFPWFLLPEEDRKTALGFCFHKDSYEAPRNFSEYILSLIHFDEAKKSKVPFNTRNIIYSPTPPFPAWFLRLREEDYRLISELAHMAYTSWHERVSTHEDVEAHPLETSGSPPPSVLPCTPPLVSPAHHTIESSGIPQVCPKPSQDSSPRLLLRTPPISRRWSF